MINKNIKILVTGGNGMLGSEVVKVLNKNKLYKIYAPSSKEMNLLNFNLAKKFFLKIQPDYFLMIAGKVGGIKDNSLKKYEYLNENLQMIINAFRCLEIQKTNKAIFVGSSCIYPKNITRKINEKDLLKGELEPTNEGYALAKISGLKLSEYFSLKHKIPIICPMFTNIYGSNDNFDLETSHVLSALVRRFVEAKKYNKKEVVIWGSGKPKREFIHVYDAARAIVFLLKNCNNYELINVGSGDELTIKNLAKLIASEVGFNGKILFDKKMPDGMLRKRLDLSKIKKMGFKNKISLKKGIKMTIRDYKKKLSS